jgi:hypothetical protein
MHHRSVQLAAWFDVTAISAQRRSAPPERRRLKFQGGGTLDFSQHCWFDGALRAGRVGWLCGLGIVGASPRGVDERGVVADRYVILDAGKVLAEEEGR